jgi:hypothetical protein
MSLVGQALGRFAAMEYCDRADAAAPPFIFADPRKFFDLCRAEARAQLLEAGDKPLTWVSMTRREDGGLDMRVGLTTGIKMVQHLDDKIATSLPVKKTYGLKLDRWARVLSLEEEKEKSA